MIPAFDQLYQQEPPQNHCVLPPGLLPLLQLQDLSHSPSQIWGSYETKDNNSVITIQPIHPTTYREPLRKRSQIPW